jgi:hypothetical protein
LTKGPNTYLNGLSLDFPSCNACGRPPEDQCDLCKMYGVVNYVDGVRQEPQRPRFMTAWIEDDDESFHATGEAFMTLEEAEAFARERLLQDHEDNQIAVFEIRSVHLGRRVVTSERA